LYRQEAVQAWAEAREHRHRAAEMTAKTGGEA
jgi:hypothetical protein